MCHSADSIYYESLKSIDLKSIKDDVDNLTKISFLIWMCENMYFNKSHLKFLEKNIDKLNWLKYIGNFDEYKICSYNEDDYYIDIFYNKFLIKAYFSYRIKDNKFIDIKNRSFLDMDQELSHIFINYYSKKYKSIISNFQMTYWYFSNIWDKLIVYAINNINEFGMNLISEDFKFLSNITKENYNDIIKNNYLRIDKIIEYYGIPENNNRFEFFRK